LSRFVPIFFILSCDSNPEMTCQKLLLMACCMFDFVVT